jgi:peptide/nickel transport system permease protein
VTAVVVRRLLIGVVVLLVVSAAVFAGTEILPGDVAHAILGQTATPELVASIRHRLALDDPAPIRYLRWLGNLLQGDLGTSLASGAPIGRQISERIANTMLLAGTTAMLAVPISVGLGLISAIRPNRMLDRAISVGSLALISMPDFLIAILLVALFAGQLGWLPAIARLDPDAGFWSSARMLALPTAALLFSVLAHMVRMTRAAMIEVLVSPPIEMAILKGMPRRRILLIHALPNALPAIINVVALNLGYLIAGIVVIETMFNIAGLGRLTVEAVATRDVPVVQACVMVFCASYVLLNMIADIVSILASPRLRFPR